MTRYFCKVAEVSPSSYRWLSTAEDRQRRAEIDEQDIRLINKQHFEAKHRQAEVLIINVRLERLDNVVMNHNVSCVRPV